MTVQVLGLGALPGKPGVNRAVATWLRERNPRWSDQDILRALAMTYVTDEHPLWDPSRVALAADCLLREEAPADE